MDISIVAVGRLKSGPETDLCDRYLSRARKSGRGLGLRRIEMRELAESQAPRADDRKTGEAEAIGAVLSGADRIICLDEGGEMADSEAFAGWLRTAADGGVSEMAFVIGGPDGLAPALLARSHRTLCFGRMTWPHQIVRALLLEQIYRATTILSGHPYHRS